MTITKTLITAGIGGLFAIGVTAFEPYVTGTQPGASEKSDKYLVLADYSDKKKQKDKKDKKEKDGTYKY